ncbi:LytR family transcriptional regulator [Nocardiopsis gilva YIM 90087]|uniref:LytR family transcriptional regulator n=1 Tax=Nocardiopsis gilva YIM 90087 TaxID=1235441 RepID=A0A223S6C7_9ACTN|nr:LCP family protein [Nocardiopsis gilva]ASU83661.1 LytR family transcriptional regulator [Nocardiopsis gilva YIM 90087]
MAAGRQKEKESRPAGTGRALLWTAGSAVLPGLAHLRTGRRTAGWVILGVYLVLIAAAIVAAMVAHGDLTMSAAIAVQGRWLLTAATVAFVIAVLWMTVVIHSWVITRPESAGVGVKLAGGTLVLALCLMIAAPAGAVVYGAYTAHDAISSVFGPEPDDPHGALAGRWGDDQARVNVLLIGGDSGSNRYGMRTDSMMVASIDVEYGDVVLIGIPRNLENAQFPKDTALAKRFPPPHGFNDLLNEVYQTVAENPQELAFDPTAKDPAADTLKGVIGHLLDIDLDYYALVDMKGFEGLIDAIGGIRVHIDKPIPYGQRGDILQPGDRVLTGNEALWYGRSRVNSDDYTRMGRQGCLIKYVAEQAEPTKILTSFQSLAGAAKQTLRTDIPPSRLPAFIELADRVKNEGDMRTFQLSPPQVNTAYPDWKEIQHLVSDAVQKQEGEQGKQGPDTAKGTPKDAPSPAPSAAPSGEKKDDSQVGESTQWQEYSGRPEPSPTTPGRQVGDAAASLDTLCP